MSDIKHQLDAETVEQIAEAIAHWDYVTNMGEEPDSDESLVLPPHFEAARAVVAALKNGGGDV